MMMEEIRECSYPLMSPQVTSVTPLTSSAPMTERPPQCSPAAGQREREVMGHYRFDLQDPRGSQSTFHLTTRRKGHSSLRHCISGLKELESCGFQEVILKEVNEEKTRGKAHNEVVCTLKRHLFSTTASTTLTLIVEGRDDCKRKHKLEVSIEVDFIYEDGPSLGDKVRAVYEIVVRVIDHVITVPDVTDVTYEDCRVVRVRHGALVGHYMKVGADSRVCMVDNLTDTDGQFKCYVFSGHDQTDTAGEGRKKAGRGRTRAGGCRGGGCGGGDDEDRWPELCVLQDLRSRRFVQVNALTSRLTTDPDKNHRLNEGITKITKPDGRFFVIIYTDKARSKVCLTPLILRNYYLRYDAVEGLKLEKLTEPPYCNPLSKRTYDFEIVPVHAKGKPVTG